MIFPSEAARSPLWVGLADFRSRAGSRVALLWFTADIDCMAAIHHSLPQTALESEDRLQSARTGKTFTKATLTQMTQQQLHLSL